MANSTLNIRQQKLFAFWQNVLSAMNDYIDKVVVVTGAGNGIGRTIALAYARQGATVIVLDKDKKGVEHTRHVLTEAGYSSTGYTLDLTKPEEIESTFKGIREDHGGIDILINNAGLSKNKSPLKLTVEDWDYVLNSNLRGSFLCARESVRSMKKRGGGAIVNIASTRALMSEPNWEAYAASKGGLVSLTHALALSLAESHITVNAISPGWIEIDDYSALKESDHAQHPSGRVGKPADVAQACLFLTHPDNNFINGANLVIDGGMTRKMIYEE